MMRAIMSIIIEIVGYIALFSISVIMAILIAVTYVGANNYSPLPCHSTVPAIPK